MEKLVLHLLFSGLIAYSPSGDLRSLSILVLNDINSGHMPHQAFLSVRSGKIVSTDFLFEPDPTVSSYAERTFIGGGYQMSIDASLLAPLSYKQCRDLLPKKDAVNLEKFCLINASDVLDDGFIVSASLLGGTGVDIANRLALRLELNSGEFRPYDQSGVDDLVTGRKMEWKMPDGSYKVSFVPEQLEWISPEIGGKSIRLQFIPFGGGQIRQVTIVPEDGKPIEVAISNEPNPLEYCLEDNKEDRYGSSHLGRFGRLSVLNEVQDSRMPKLSSQVDRDAIDNDCNSYGKTGGRLPIICYGAGMGR